MGCRGICNNPFTKYGQCNGMNILCLLFGNVEPAVQSYCGDDFSRSIYALFSV